MRLETALLGQTVLIAVANADESEVAAAVLTPSGALELLGTRSVLVAPGPDLGRWYVLTLSLDPAGTATLAVDDEDGAEVGRATLHLDGRIDARAVCVGLPAGGEAATELYIDEFRITY